MDARVELRRFARKILSQEPLIFVRFSDGELEILRGHRLDLSTSGIVWSKGESGFTYPDYDHKSFDPDKDVALQAALTESAVYRANGYFKGIPTRHNKDADATEMMYRLNGQTWENLSFADLWVNSNYKLFLRELVDPLKQQKVNLVANFRAKPKLVSPHWDLIPIPDRAFQAHEQVKAEVISQIMSLPKHSVILASASSLSNIIGLELAKRELEVTFVDVGTALHPQLGFEDSKRLYLSQMKPWRLDTLREKLAYLSSGGGLKW